MLSSLKSAIFPIPMGIFRRVEKPSYGEILNEQITKAKASKKDISLEDFFNSMYSWVIN